MLPHGAQLPEARILREARRGQEVLCTTVCDVLHVDDDVGVELEETLRRQYGVPDDAGLARGVAPTGSIDEIVEHRPPAGGVPGAVVEEHARARRTAHTLAHRVETGAHATDDSAGRSRLADDPPGELDAPLDRREARDRGHSHDRYTGAREQGRRFGAHVRAREDDVGCQREDGLGISAHPPSHPRCDVAYVRGGRVIGERAQCDQAIRRDEGEQDLVGLERRGHDPPNARRRRHLRVRRTRSAARRRTRGERRRTEERRDTED